MIDPRQLLDLARYLIEPLDGRTSNDAALRRGVSTAYYAVFHTALRAGADRFHGDDIGISKAYSTIYRGFAHGRIRTICGALAPAMLSPAFRRQLGRDIVSPAARNFAALFGELQDARNSADYDPASAIDLPEARRLVSMASDAISAFDQIPLDEKTDILALMLVSSRP